MEKDNATLSPQQRLALINFERFRVSKLTNIKDELAFQNEFQRLQSMAKFSKYEDFLNDEYL